MSEFTEHNGSGVGLTVRDLVLEVRADVKDLKANSVSREAFIEAEARIQELEDSRLILRGVWLSTGIAASVVAGTAGLVIGCIALFVGGA